VQFSCDNLCDIVVPFGGLSGFKKRNFGFCCSFVTFAGFVVQLYYEVGKIREYLCESVAKKIILLF
jgi:hypothetical protein